MMPSTAITMGRIGYEVKMPNTWNMFILALWMHIGMFMWNPTLLSGGHINQAPVLMQVEFRDKAPELPKPAQVVKKVEPKPIVKKAHKSGIALAHHSPVHIHPTHHVTKVAKAALPAPRTRISQVKMPKFVPHASDEDALASVNHPAKLATATALRPTTSPFITTPKLAGKTRGIRASDVHFQLTDRGTSIDGSAAVVAIPVGEERGETASIASAPELHDAPRGIHHTSNSYQAPLGEGVGELAGKNRSGYVGTIEVSGAMPSEEEVIAAGSAHGSAAGKGVEIGGPIGDRKILRRHLPEYPAWAEEKGISAIVKIFFTVQADGTIRHSLRIVHSSGYTELDSLAKEALLEWKFSPTHAASTADEAWGVITFKFTLA